MARFRRKTLKGKAFEKHSDTLVSVIGPGTATIPFLLVRDSEVGPRDASGATDTITLGRGNNEECNVGDTCKFINLTLQVAPRLSQDVSIGWVEWAFVIMKSSDPTITNANLGIHTLGDVATKYLRNQCIYTGAVPVGAAQPNVATISLKIPQKSQMLRQGDEWRFYYHARTSNATTTATDTFVVFSSFNYKNYH